MSEESVRLKDKVAFKLYNKEGILIAQSKSRVSRLDRLLNYLLSFLKEEGE